ncbi:M23 family metallopeptidase [Chitinophaga horti]|uniref:M23 family metallopeptidase n=1 Tax=Chitinophaga horti TaxID=2920382 RepID=A0ABY6J7F8_9BACT|nr:M23 family metallopeptidase [Chitinophaga horti]UYQ94229.1 M23 family metallopeptidase [Chitinophaga horti]
MINYLLLSITIILALYSLLLAYTASRKPLPDAGFQAALSLALALFIYLYGTWVYLSIYARYAFGILYIMLAAYALLRRRRDQPSGKRLALWRRISLSFFTITMLILTVLYFTGTTGKPDTVNLGFPFKTGRYFVLQGGKGLPSNFFHFSIRGAIYAMDIVQLNKYGGRANSVFSRNLEDYAIFGDTVFSPCSGRVVRAETDNPDNIPPNMQRGPKNTNMVVIETEEYTVFLAHLKRGSVKVKEGDMIQKGQPLGAVGNSGFSAEPHLHIQVHAKEGDKPWYQSKPLYILFNGRGYLFNEVINARKGY